MESGASVAEQKLAMAINRIQFQPGLSMLKFLNDYGTEAQVVTAAKMLGLISNFR